MKDENNVIETKTEKENKMSDTEVEITKESNTILSKLSEWQFNELRYSLMMRTYYVGGFYPTLNTEILTEMRKNFNWKQDVRCKVDITEDEFISIVKDYGSVTHSIDVNGTIKYLSTDLSDYLNFDISAEKIEEIGVDEIEDWGRGYDLERTSKNLKSHSIIYRDLEDEAINESAESCDIFVSGVSVMTKVSVSLPKRE
jgi:hypothetical protein